MLLEDLDDLYIIGCPFYNLKLRFLSWYTMHATPDHNIGDFHLNCLSNALLLKYSYSKSVRTLSKSCTQFEVILFNITIFMRNPLSYFHI